MRIAIGNDHAGFELKEFLRDRLKSFGYEVEDLGCHYPTSCDYPVYAHRVARAVAAGEFEFGILICGTGLGMSMSANKIKGIRAALCRDATFAELARRHNNANILCLAGRFTEPDDALEITLRFLTTGFDGDTPQGQRHKRRVELIEPKE